MKKAGKAIWVKLLKLRLSITSKAVKKAVNRFAPNSFAMGFCFDNKDLVLKG
jgi:hypothetical protein